MIDPAGLARAAVARAEAARGDLAALRAMQPLLRDPAWLGALTGQALGAMVDDPHHLPPFAASRHGFLGQLTLASAGRVSIGVTLIAGAAARGQMSAPPAPTVSFSGQRTMSRLLSADPLVIRRAWLDADGRLRSRAARWQPGTVLTLDETREAIWLAPPERAVCLLRVRIRPAAPMPVRSFDLASGRSLATVQGDDGAARSNMLLSVLRALGDTAAIPLFEQLVDTSQGAARWGVMREWLALDAPSAWPRLSAMASADPDGAVRRAAAATLSRFAPLRAA